MRQFSAFCDFNTPTIASSIRRDFLRFLLAMSSVTLTKELKKCPRSATNKLRSGYNIDFRQEVVKRWLVLGVLFTVLLAVVTPKIGAPGGYLLTEYTVYLPLSYIYFTAGRSCVSFPRASRRACVVGMLHAHIVAPALAISLAQAVVERDSANRGLLTGIILSSIGAPCGWLSLSICTGASERTRAPAILVCNYMASLVAEPLYIFVLCGRFTHPPVFPTLLSVITTSIAFYIGTRHHMSSSPHHRASSAYHRVSSATLDTSSTNYTVTSTNNNISSSNPVISSTNPDISSTKHAISSVTHVSSSTRAQCCALVALYVECCTRLREAEGELYVTHVFATLILVLGWLCLNALFCCVYYRSGTLSYDETYTVALCSVPKCLDVGWEFGTLCVPTGLSLLPAAFLAPSQALLLAAAIRHDEDDGDEVVVISEVGE